MPGFNKLLFFSSVMRQLCPAPNKFAMIATRFIGSQPSTCQPDSEEYLKAQKMAFEKNNIVVTMNTLEQGTLLIGLNVNELQPHFLASPPMRKSNSIFSEKERDAIRDMQEKYRAKLTQFWVLKTITCIATKSERGETIYHVHPQQVKMGKSISFGESDRPAESDNELSSYSC